jgi:hypothetical protein
VITGIIICTLSLFGGDLYSYLLCKGSLLGSSLPPVVCRRSRVLSTLFVFVCIKWCLTHIVVCVCVVCLRLVYPMLSVSLDCPFLIAPSMFSNIYKTNMVNNSTDINKTNIHLSREITEHKIARHIFR